MTFDQGMGTNACVHRKKSWCLQYLISAHGYISGHARGNKKVRKLHHTQVPKFILEMLLVKNESPGQYIVWESKHGTIRDAQAWEALFTVPCTSLRSSAA